MKLSSFRSALLVACCMFPSLAAADLVIDGVPLPDDVSLPAAAQSNSKFQALSDGVWVGVWGGGGPKHLLVVESIADDGSAKVVYAIGDNPVLKIPPQWMRLKAKITAKSIKVFGSGFSANYELSSTGRLRASVEFGKLRGYAAMTKMDWSALKKPDFTIASTRGKSELLQTTMMENDKSVQLEVVVFRPPGEGPFPLAVINHGSTGSGDDSAIFTVTWTAPFFADFLNERGWIVAFPQRRGRGKSSGIYDEGFWPDRAKGYTCDAVTSLAGADRALGDIEAAITTLSRRPDVNNSRILIGGVSRGGVLSVAYAGRRPDQIAGVLNFVGGWLGEGCKTATDVSGELFKRGTKFEGSTLWMYGNGDPFYSMPHNRKNFNAFKSAGGQGTFLEFDVPGGDGHSVISHPPLWMSPVNQYLDTLRPEPR